MKTTSEHGSRHGLAAVLAAIALAAGCSSGSGSGSGFGDPASDAGGADDSGYGASSSGAGMDASSSSGGRHSSSGDGSADVAATCTSNCSPCHGVPATCSSMASETACTAPGCTWGGACVGTALACPAANRSQCGLQQNCTYDSVTGQCSGTAYDCYVLAAAYACTTQVGCAWQMGCNGTPTACSSHSDSASCTGAGCQWK